MEHILRAEKISKRFPGVQAVDDVSFNLRRGEIMALVGENGAGKSTLMQILGGSQTAEAGQIFLDGQPVSFHSAHDGLEAGIAMVFQELSLIGTLSIAENIFANRQPVGRLNNIQWRQLYQETEAVLNTFDLDLDPAMLVKVRVIPNAARSEVVGWVDDVLKIKVRAVPEDGKANKAVCELIAGIAGCRARQLTIQSGEKSRVKLLDVPVEGDPKQVFG